MFAQILVLLGPFHFSLFSLLSVLIVGLLSVLVLQSFWFLSKPVLMTLYLSTLTVVYCVSTHGCLTVHYSKNHWVGACAVFFPTYQIFCTRH